MKKKQKPKKSNHRKPRILNPAILFHRKLLLVMEQNPEIECTGRGIDEDGNEYAYTEAENVFAIYSKSMRDVGLTCIPVELNTVFQSRCVLVTAKYKLTDVDTGYSEIISGSGLGTNGVWAANSAQTIALKQALLETFMASWPQPPELKEKIKDEVAKVFGGGLSDKQAVKEICDYFDQVLGAKKNGTDRIGAGPIADTGAKVAGRSQQAHHKKAGGRGRGK